MTHATHDTAGLLAEFANPEALILGASGLRDDGYVEMDAFTPFPVEELPEALGRTSSPIPWIVLAGGLLGGSSLFGLALWVSAVAYPLNVGGRPLNSWPSFVPPTFEGTVLFASFAAFLGVFYLSRLPRLHHPVFEIERFRRASTDSFFLLVESTDGKFDRAQTEQRLRDLGASEVWEVPDA